MTAVRLSKVLIATGSSVLREMLRIVFQSHADSVTTAADFQIATSTPAPELVLCDLDLGDGDGFRLLERVRALPSAPPERPLASNRQAR